MRKIFAFTLAEVLIALAIVGVVGAISIPNLSKTYQQKEALARVKKAVHLLDGGVLALVRDYESIENTYKGKTTDADKSEALLKSLSKYIKFSNYCGKTSVNQGCFPIATIKDVSGAAFVVKYPEKTTDLGLSAPGAKDTAKCSTALLNDGTSMAVCVVDTSFQDCGLNTSNSADDNDDEDFCPNAVVFFDIDGALKGASVLSRDIYAGYLSDNGFTEIGDNIKKIEKGKFE